MTGASDLKKTLHRKGVVWGAPLDAFALRERAESELAAIADPGDPIPVRFV